MPALSPSVPQVSCVTPRSLAARLGLSVSIFKLTGSRASPGASLRCFGHGRGASLAQHQAGHGDSVEQALGDAEPVTLSACTDAVALIPAPKSIPGSWAAAPSALPLAFCLQLEPRLVLPFPTG